MKLNYSVPSGKVFYTAFIAHFVNFVQLGAIFLIVVWTSTCPCAYSASAGHAPPNQGVTVRPKGKVQAKKGKLQKKTPHKVSGVQLFFFLLFPEFLQKKKKQCKKTAKLKNSKQKDCKNEKENPPQCIICPSWQITRVFSCGTQWVWKGRRSRRAAGRLGPAGSPQSAAAPASPGRQDDVVDSRRKRRSWRGEWPPAATARSHPSRLSRRSGLGSASGNGGCAGRRGRDSRRPSLRAPKTSLPRQLGVE